MSDERGVVGLYVAVVFTAVLLIAGLLVDGGAIRTGRREAGDVAARAARAGAQEIDVDLLMSTGVVELDPASASAAARSFLGAAGWAGSVEVGARTVTVSVQRSVPMRLLSMVGVADKTVIATRTARAAEGVVEG